MWRGVLDEITAIMRKPWRMAVNGGAFGASSWVLALTEAYNVEAAPPELPAFNMMQLAVADFVVRGTRACGLMRCSYDPPMSTRACRPSPLWPGRTTRAQRALSPAPNARAPFRTPPRA
jgi:hypothetical protein